MDKWNRKLGTSKKKQDVVTKKDVTRRNPKRKNK